MLGMFWIALELSIPKIGFNIMLSLTDKKVDVFKFEGVAESDNTAYFIALRANMASIQSQHYILKSEVLGAFFSLIFLVSAGSKTFASYRQSAERGFVTRALDLRAPDGQSPRKAEAQYRHNCHRACGAAESKRPATRTSDLSIPRHGPDHSADQRRFIPNVFRTGTKTQTALQIRLKCDLPPAHCTHPANQEQNSNHE